MIINRRKLLALSGISLLAPIVPSYKAFGKSFEDRKLIFITLRGGMDGLAAFPLLGDKISPYIQNDTWFIPFSCNFFIRDLKNFSSKHCSIKA